MDFVIEELTGPTNPRDFVGRSQLMDKYYELIRDFLRSNKTIRWVHISGSAGTGKSSLFRKLRMMAEQDERATIYHHLIARAIDYFYTDTKRLLDIVGCSGAAN